MVDVNIQPGKAYLRGDSEDGLFVGAFRAVLLDYDGQCPPPPPPPDYLGTATAGIVSVQRRRSVISGS